MNYEESLEHANLWGAHSGVTVRYRMPTSAGKKKKKKNQNGRSIPDMEKEGTEASEIMSRTINSEDGVKRNKGEECRERKRRSVKSRDN